MQYYQEGGRYGAGSSQDSQGSAGIPGKDDDRKLFVGSVHRMISEKDLKDYFGKFGDIESITIKVDPYTGQSRGFAFIVFSDSKAIDDVLETKGHYVNNKRIDPKKVSKKNQQGKIFVGGLTPEVSNEDVTDFFSQFGKVVEIQAPIDKKTNKRKGYCFVTFETKDVVFSLLKTPEQYIKGVRVDVKKVKVNPETMGATRGQAYNWMTNYAYTGYYGGYNQDYVSNYGNGGYEYYGYDGYNDYSTYGYRNMGNMLSYPPAAKPKGTGRPVQRSQAY